MRLGIIIEHTVAHVPTADGGWVEVISNFVGKTTMVGKSSKKGTTTT